MWGHLRHLFLPHHTNNHRARVLHIDALFLYALFFAVFAAVSLFVRREAPDILGYATDIYADQLLSETNQKRAEAGLPPLMMNSQLSQAAAAKAQDMFAKDYWAHNSPDGKTPWDFIKGSGYVYTLAGENLAKNFSDSSGVVNAWMASPSHRDNLLKAGYRDVGFAVVNGVLNGEETTLVVQMFGSTTVTQAPVAAKKSVPTTVPTKRPVAMAPTQIPEPVSQREAEPVTELSGGRSANEATPVAAATRGGTTFISPGLAPLFAGTFLGVSDHPLFNLGKISGALAYGFIGFLMAVFVLDAFVVAKKRIVRVSGNNLTHLFFLTALTFLVGFATRGSIL